MLYQGKGHSGFSLSFCSENSEQERERSGGDWRAKGRRPVAVSPRSARAEGEKSGNIAPASEAWTSPRSQTPFAFITYALALHDNDLYRVFLSDRGAPHHLRSASRSCHQHRRARRSGPKVMRVSQFCLPLFPFPPSIRNTLDMRKLV